MHLEVMRSQDVIFYGDIFHDLEHETTTGFTIGDYSLYAILTF